MHIHMLCIVTGASTLCLVSAPCIYAPKWTLAMLLLSVGQSSQQQSTSTPLSNSKVTVPSILFMNQRFAMEMMVLDNPSVLPVPCDGLLGLDFFKALNNDVLMDFKGSFLKCGNYLSLLPIALRSEFELLSSKKVLSGLPVVSSSIPVPSSSMIDASDSSSSIIMPGSKPIVCNAMLDVGSLYTIANSAATRDLLVERYGSTRYGLNDLPATSTICAGIDGRPLPLRLLRIPYIQIGIYHCSAYNLQNDGLSE